MRDASSLGPPRMRSFSQGDPTLRAGTRGLELLAEKKRRHQHRQ